MTTKTRGRAPHDRYFALVRRTPLLPLRNERELDRALAMVEDLMRQARLDADERGYLDVLSDLVEKYEEKHHPIPDPSDADLLRSLIEARETTQADVARATGIAQPALCEILAGKRRIARAHMGRLAKFFHVSPAVFVPEE